MITYNVYNKNFNLISKKIKIVLYFFLITSCGAKKTKFLDSENCSELSHVFNSDQAIRLKGIDNVKKYQDSVLIKSEQIHNMKKGFYMRSLFFEFIKNDKNLDSTFKKFNNPPINKDYAIKYLEEAMLIWDKRHIVDHENLEKLIVFTKRYGYPNTNRFKNKCKKANNIYIVYLHHIANKELKTLVNKEYKAGRIPDLDYNWIYMDKNEKGSKSNKR